MKIGILQTGRALKILADRHGDFNELFIQLLANQGLEFETYAAMDQVLPETVDECDGWLVTGSPHSSYEDLPWIPLLENFLRRVYDADVPIVGICFGHQILAQALGGKVEKFADGWSLGPQQYQFDGIEKPVVINAWHQDQVTQLADNCEVVGRSDFCANAAILYGKRAYSIQAHPEFHNDFVDDLIDKRRETVPADLVDEAEGKLKSAEPSSVVVEEIVSFFKSRKISAST